VAQAFLYVRLVLLLFRHNLALCCYRHEVSFLAA